MQNKNIQIKTTYIHMKFQFCLSFVFPCMVAGPCVVLGIFGGPWRSSAVSSGLWRSSAVLGGPWRSLHIVQVFLGLTPLGSSFWRRNMSVCSFNRFGYCKYGNYCFRKHKNATCENAQCNISDCSLRHPKKC